MNKYELSLILSASVSEEVLTNTLKKYTDMIETSGGKVLGVNKVGVKKFAYPINYKKEGHYVYVDFESAASMPSKLQALFNIDEVVTRSLFIKK